MSGFAAPALAMYMTMYEPDPNLSDCGADQGA